MATIDQRAREVISTQDVARWVTFSGFWGTVFYLLGFIGLLAGQRRQPVTLNTGTALVGLGLQVGGFIALGSSGAAISSLIRGRSTTAQARETISGDKVERNIVPQSLGAAAASIIPFAMTVGNVLLAERITGRPAIGGNQPINWPVALGTTTVLNGLAAFTVSRIAAWVARDARNS